MHVREFINHETAIRLVKLSIAKRKAFAKVREEWPLALIYFPLLKILL
jgi:hypothetical protein